MSETSVRDRLNQDLKTSMRAKEADRVGVFRLIFAEIKQKEVDQRIVLTDADIVAVMEKMLKQRRDSIEQFKKAARQDLVDKEEFEVSLIQTYMPKPLSDDEIMALIQQQMTTLKAKTPDSPLGPQSLGLIISALRPLLAGKADMAKVSGLVKKQLSNASI